MKKFYQYLLVSGLMIFVMGTCSAVIADDVQIHGFISQGYLKTDKNSYLAETEDGTFQFNEMGINFTTYATQRLKVGCQFFARDIGNVGNDKIVVNWAFGEYNFRNWLGLRAGLVKMPIGLYGDIRDYDSLRTPIFLPSSVYSEYFRDGNTSMKGIELFGSQSIGVLGILKYQFMVGGTQIPLDSGTAELLRLNFPTLNLHLTNVDIGTIYANRLDWLTPLDGLRLLATYVKTDYLFSAENDDKTLTIMDKVHKTQWYTFSVEYIWNNLTLSAENWITDADTTRYISRNSAPATSSSAGGKTSFDDCFYLKASYRFTDWLETGYYYSEFIDDPNASGNTNELKDQCFSFRFDINPFWLCKLEAHLMDGGNGVAEDSNGRLYHEWMLYAAKVTFMF